MSPDIRETLNRGAPEPLSRLDVNEIAGRALRLRRRNRVLAVAGVVLIASLAAPLTGALLSMVRNKSVGNPAGSVESVTYRDPSDTWEITNPRRFYRSALPRLQGYPRITYEGVWIANFDSPDFDLRPTPRQIPDNGVFVEVFQQFGGAPYIPDDPDSEFPISYGDLKVERGLYTGEWRTITAIANGEPYTVVARIGKDAATEDRQAVTEIISSLRFLPLEAGSTTGRQITYFVLDEPSAFPVGSVSLFDKSNLPESDYRNPPPFYLVHVAEGFYALSWQDDRQGGYKDCDVKYERSKREFYCSNGARWALDGSVIAKPQGRFPDDPLGVRLVRISLDGHVLVSPNVTMSQTNVDLRNT